ncbi:MAG: VWA domain-containing protein [Planctomycetota bacterium]|jgi:Mg-chelatase subunit ChlD
MSLSLLHPAYLVLLLLAAAVWVGPWRARSAAQGVLRTLVLALLAVGLARPVTVTAQRTATRVWILDRSASIGDTLRRAGADRLLAELSREAVATDVLITFGSPIDEQVRERFDRVLELDDRGMQGGSPLQAALCRAAAEIPDKTPGGVIIVSDGMETRADDGRAASLFRARGIPVNVLVTSAQDDARPVGLSWSGELRAGTTASLTAALAGTSGGGDVVLESADGELARAPFAGMRGRGEVTIEFEPRVGGFQDVQVRVLDAGDGDSTNNTLDVTLPIQDPRRLLYVGGRQQGGAERLGELLGSGFEVTNAGEGLTEEAIGRADLVVLDDLAAEDMPASVQRVLVSAVADDGLGLVMSGGRSSFGAGGWHDTLVETVLPVELIQKEEKRDPSTTLVVIIDTSGSMSGTRVQLAKEVSRLAIRRLMPHDKVGIVEFYGAKRWAAPIQPASNAIEIERALNRLDAGGGTVILPAIEEAFYGMQNVDSRYKHVLILTDGGVEAGAFEPLLRQMADDGINATTVLVGGGIHSEFLVNIANWGKGRFYSVPDRFSLPEIIFKQPSSAKLPSYREGVHAVQARGGRGWWGDVDATEVPDLDGYVEGRARPGAEVILETRNGAHPVLTSWRWGLGRVTTMATEPVGAGTGGWRDWPDYGRSLARVLDRTASDGRSAFDFSASTIGSDVVVTARRLVHGDATLEPLLERVEPSGERTPVALRRRAPDVWEARVLAPPVGEHLAFEGTDTRGGAAPGRRIVGRSAIVAEAHVDPADAIDLDLVAGLTGGRSLLLDGSSPPAVSTSAGVRLRSHAPWLLLLSLLTFFGELAWRRRP